ncbi:hypothetical protein CGRA01v4_11547 [Colletotrichum graminicola]|nr:hypothetical protein CGRA01v4_11547 [Colletotrichum graminicola]
MPQFQDVVMTDYRSANICGTGTGMSRCRQSLESSSEEHASTQFWGAVHFHTRWDEAIRKLWRSRHLVFESPEECEQVRHASGAAILCIRPCQCWTPPTACIQIGLRPSSARILPRMKLHCLEATRKGGIANATLSDTTSRCTARPPSPSLGRLSGRQCESTFGLWKPSGFDCYLRQTAFRQ